LDCKGKNYFSNKKGFILFLEVKNETKMKKQEKGALNSIKKRYFYG